MSGEEITRIEFIQQEVAVVPYSRNTDGSRPVDLPEIANESEYNAILEKDPFQAYLPVLVPRNEYTSNPTNLEWLGTVVWPRSAHEAAVNNNGLIIGNGRSTGPCNCKMPGSVACVHRHMLEEREKLKAELGPAFEAWKFNDMGFDYGDGWTLRDVRRFSTIMKKRDTELRSRNTFLLLARRILPHKTTADVVNYYFNVYLPCTRNRLRKTLSDIGSAAEIDTDDDDDKAIAEKLSNADNGTQNPFLKNNR